MKVRCKFKCEFITDFGQHKSVTLIPVTSGSKENESFYKWTPSGKIEFNTINVDAANLFTVGGEYYIDISKANTGI